MEPEQPKDNHSQTKQYLKYSGMGFQMIAVLLVSLWAGQWLDKRLGMANPIFTVVLLLVGIGGSMYLIIKGVLQNRP